MTTPAQRASVLRPIVARAVQRGGLRATAREVGISYTAVSNFVTDGVTPQSRTLDAFEQWAVERGLLEGLEAAVAAPNENADELDDWLPGYLASLRFAMGREDQDEGERRERVIDSIRAQIRAREPLGLPTGALYRALATIEDRGTL